VFRVALTFDAEHPDRPSAAGVQERLLEQLSRDGVRATFFIQGRWAEAYPETARLIAEGGHLIGNHSHYHARMPLLSARGLRSDISAAEAAIIETIIKGRKGAMPSHKDFLDAGKIHLLTAYVYGLSAPDGAAAR